MSNLHPWLEYFKSLSAPPTMSDTKLLNNMLDEQDNNLTMKSLKFAMQTIKYRDGSPASIAVNKIWTTKKNEHSAPLYLIDSKGLIAYFDGNYGFLQWRPGYFLCISWSDVWLVRRVHGKVQYWLDTDHYNKHWKEQPGRKNPYEILKDPGELTYVDSVLDYFSNTIGYATKGQNVPSFYMAVHAPSDMVPRIRSFLGLRTPVIKRRDRRKERTRRKKARKSK